MEFGYFADLDDLYLALAFIEPRRFLKNLRNLILFSFFLKTGECGKSTILKQMCILHKGGFSAKEKNNYVTLVHTNIFDTCMHLCKLYQALSRTSKIDADILQTSV